MHYVVSSDEIVLTVNLLSVIPYSIFVCSEKRSVFIILNWERSISGDEIIQLRTTIITLKRHWTKIKILGTLDQIVVRIKRPINITIFIYLTKLNLINRSDAVTILNYMAGIRVWVEVKSIKTFKPTEINPKTLLGNHLDIGVNISFTGRTGGGGNVLFHTFPINSESTFTIRILIFTDLRTILITGDQNWRVQIFHFFFGDVVMGIVK